MPTSLLRVRAGATLRCDVAARQAAMAPRRLAGATLLALASAQVAAQSPETAEPVKIVLPPHLPAACFQQAASDYRVPPLVMLAMVKTESQGRSVIARNNDGSMDYGVAQHNTNSWVPYFEKRYRIPREALLDPCQSVRAQAYVLRYEMNHRECGGTDVWCAVGRYHAPYSAVDRNVYVAKVRRAVDAILSAGSFETGRSRVPASAAPPATPSAPAAAGATRQAAMQRLSFDGSP